MNIGLRIPAPKPEQAALEHSGVAKTDSLQQQHYHHHTITVGTRAEHTQREAPFTVRE